MPLLIKLPGSALAGGTVAAPVQLTDLFPTLLGLVGAPKAPARPGTVSLASLAGGAPASDRRVFAENYSPRIRLGWSELRALVSDRFHYIEAPTPELYDVAADPAQRTNLASTRPPELRSMVVETERRRTPLRAPEAVDAEAAKKLQALGYLTGTARDDGGARPDPKEAIGSLTTLQTATRLHEAGRSAEAVPLLQEVLCANPRLVDGWEVLASAHERLGRMDEALAALKKTVALSPPGRSNYVADVAALALRAGRLDEARSHAELARTFGEGRAGVVLARVALREGKLGEAPPVAGAGLARGGTPAGGPHGAGGGAGAGGGGSGGGAPRGEASPAGGPRSAAGASAFPRRSGSTARSSPRIRGASRRSPASRSSPRRAATSPRRRAAPRRSRASSRRRTAT